MSEPMTTVEIEDVLSSIRRLVSEDLRPTHKLVSAALKLGASKLILTPALRIVSDLRTALPDPVGPHDEPRELQSVLLEIDTEDEARSADIMPVFGSVRVLDQSERTGQVRPEQRDASSFDANFLASAMSRINGLSTAEGDLVAQGHAETIEAVVAVVGAAVGPEEWEVDGGEPAPQDKAWADTVWNSDLQSDTPIESDEAAQATIVRSDGAVGWDATTETVLHDIQTDTILAQQPVEDNGVDLASDSIVFHDVDPAVAENSKRDAVAPSEAADDLDEAGGFLSEDLLREIVRDMIRQELQGTLGERITRNVRKLVRAEINRAMASRDFDDVASRG